jgi:hypothetical protein
MSRSIFRSRRAVSGIVGGVFLVTIIFLSTNVLIWYYSQEMGLFAQARKAQQLAQERDLEQLAIQKLFISSSRPNATILNTGGVPVHIVDIVITSLSDVPVWHKIYSVNYFITPGSTGTNIGQTISATLDSGKTYTIRFVTERGNSLSAQYSPTAVYGGFYATFGMIGYLSINFDQTAFRYTSAYQSTPISAWTLSYSKACYGSYENPIWWVTFVNHGVYDAVVRKWSLVQMFSVTHWYQQDWWHSLAFYIVADSSYPGHLASYTDSSITVPASLTGDYQTGGQATTMKFAAQSAGGNSHTSNWDCDTGDTYDYFIVVSYMYNGQQFNQFIPYAAAVVTS